MSKRRRAAVSTLCLLLTAAFIWLDHSSIRRDWQAQPKSGEQTKVRDFEKYHEKTFAVVNVTDGDTIDINVPDDKYNHTRVRLWGIDAPETKNPKTGIMYFGPEAADFTKNQLLESRSPFISKNIALEINMADCWLILNCRMGNF